MLSKIPHWLKNKYAFTALFFIVWVLFFDQNDIITQFGYRSELNTLEKDRDFYRKEILKTKTELEELTTNPKTLEKFAREKYFMKKNNEEIFVFTAKK